MNNTKIVEILKTFSKEEIKQFTKFLKSPYFGAIQSDLDFFKTLISYYPGFRVSKVEIFRKLYGNKPYNDALIRKYVSNLNKHADSFILQKEIELNKDEGSLILFRGLRKRNLNSHFEKQVLQFEKDFEKRPVDETLYLLKAEIAKEKDRFTYNVSSNKFDEETANRGFYYIIQFLFELANSIDVLSAAESSKKITGKKNTTEVFIKYLDIKNILKDLPEGKDIDSVTTKVNLLLLLCFKDFENEEHYFDLKKTVFENIGLFDKEYLFTSVLGIMLNYAIRKMRLEKEGFLNECFELTCKRLDLRDKIFAYYAPEFNNSISFALGLNKIKWADEFLEKYISYVEPNIREDLYKYSKGLIYHAKGEYENALVSLSKSNIDLYIFKMYKYNMMAVLYYDLGYFESALFQHDSYKQFINKNKDMPPLHKSPHLNFLKHYKMLVMLRMNFSKGRLTEFKDIIESGKYIGRRQWFLKKIEELEKLK